MRIPKPLVVVVTRGSGIESRHEVAAAVVDAAGRRIREWGDTAGAVFPRSAIKPIQAIPLVQSGAARQFGLEDAELALACSSHRGEPAHTDRVESWLKRMGIDVSALECGAHAPRAAAPARELICSGTAATALYNNCSGKHAGMLATSLHLDEDIAGYTLPQHPCQIRVLRALEALCDMSVASAPVGVDGCGIPAVAIPLWRLAYAYARFANPLCLGEELSAPIFRLQRAMSAEPLLVDGTGRFTTDVISATGGAVLAKSGAEGVYAAAIPAEGIGIALKVLDGGPRAAPFAMGALLAQLGFLTAEQRRCLRLHLAVDVANCGGAKVGEMRIAGFVA